MNKYKMTQLIPTKILARQHEITRDYLNEIDKHLLDLIEGRRMDMYEIRDFAEILHIHPTHLSNTIKLTTGNAPCFYFEEKIMNAAKTMIEEDSKSINEIAVLLTFDPSNFTKFFKRFSGITPKQYREQIRMMQLKTEPVTI
jgi:AraC family transcriptional regulator, regulatory protein of adaptative response / methylphosphotriester-DNA alkyltransferase methyltransferase